MSVLYDFPNLSPEQRAANQVIATIENSARHQNLIQAEQAAFAEQAARDAETEKQSEKFRVEREAELRREAEQRRQAAAVGFEKSLRERFFRGNEFATEADFQRMLPKLRENAMLDRMQTEADAEDLMRATGNYSAM